MESVKTQMGISIRDLLPRGGGYSQKNWVGVCGSLLKTLTLFMTKICPYKGVPPPPGFAVHLQFQAIQSEGPGTGQKERMERTISVRKFRLGILVHLSRNPVFPGNFPFGKLVFSFTFQPKFPDFFCKW